ncbi:hypothetical protein KPF23_07785 [Riemerella anatipestifer]|uniref:hypothetical protein n=1 Tax=Riemerella anatipestifer TaxID=34085 RepID=UPI00129DFDEF|nr:hypothetical protein [Riemerella anatipestifer]MDR7693989.1 hypothetical protein [Riemerella anatipestifer]MDR7794109.1 hypothetical protein [Riemerella anatipestifer]MDY3509669.1 hypothetical protein [Riemerella anatipestifer]MRM86478.1 hypothetical protein [Riemerella anatipestifer]MRN16903.1 hypothetical protein [Riemerella anatipestifer]
MFLGKPFFRKITSVSLAWVYGLALLLSSVLHSHQDIAYNNNETSSQKQNHKTISLKGDDCSICHFFISGHSLLPEKVNFEVLVSVATALIIGYKILDILQNQIVYFLLRGPPSI